MIKVDKEKCIGCGLCIEICDEIFYLDEQGKSVARDVDPKDVPACVKDAAEQCPVKAITL